MTNKVDFVRVVLKDFEVKNGRKPETIEDFRHIGQVAREMQKIAAEPELDALPAGDETVWN